METVAFLETAYAQHPGAFNFGFLGQHGIESVGGSPEPAPIAAHPSQVARTLGCAVRDLDIGVEGRWPPGRRTGEGSVILLAH